MRFDSMWMSRLCLFCIGGIRKTYECIELSNLIAFVSDFLEVVLFILLRLRVF